MHILTSPEANPKIAKGIQYGYLTAPLHLAPAKLSGYQVCPMSSAGCRAACLNTAGRGVYSKVQQARIRKTKLFFEDRKEFFRLICKDIESLQRKAKSLSLRPALRLNATSDIAWEGFELPNTSKNVFETYPEIQFYCYTKILKIVLRAREDNLHLTFSLSETNLEDAERAFRMNGCSVNVAVVFFKELPRRFDLGAEKGLWVIDGDTHDLRFLDPKGVVVGLRAKGKAKKDMTGFTEKLKLGENT